MGQADYLSLGDWNAACYECGMKFKASDLRRHWKGYYVCVPHWEPRQPQDFVRGVPDIQTPPWVQDQSNTFLAFCAYPGWTAIPGYMVPGCMIPGQKLIPGYDLNNPAY
jgi:hypothetical protein